MKTDNSFDVWSQGDVAGILMKQFKKHIIGLLIALKLKGENDYRQTIYTGFMLFYRNVYLWVSAGHVINHVSQIVESKDIADCVIRWADDFNLEGAENVPASFGPEDLFSTFHKEDDPDFGMIAIPRLDATCLLKNSELKPINESIWHKHETASPSRVLHNWFSRRSADFSAGFHE